MLRDTSIVFATSKPSVSHSEALQLTSTVLKSPIFGPADKNFPRKMSQMLQSSMFTVDPSLPDPSDAISSRPSRGVEAELLDMVRSWHQRDFPAPTMRTRAHSTGSISKAPDTPATTHSAPVTKSVRFELPGKSPRQVKPALSAGSSLPLKSCIAWVDYSNVNLPRDDLAFVHTMYDMSVGRPGGKVHQTIMCEAPSAALMARNINGRDMRSLLSEQAKLRAPVPLPQEIIGIAMRAGVSLGEPNLKKAQQCIRKREEKKEPEQDSTAEETLGEKPERRHRTYAQKKKSLKRQTIHQAWRKEQVGLFEAVQDCRDEEKLNARAARKAHVIWTDEFKSWSEHNGAEIMGEDMENSLIAYHLVEIAESDDFDEGIATQEAGDVESEVAGINTPSTDRFAVSDDDVFMESGEPSHFAILVGQEPEAREEDHPDESSTSSQQTQDNEPKQDKETPMLRMTSKNEKVVTDNGLGVAINGKEANKLTKEEDTPIRQANPRGQYRFSNVSLGKYASEDLNVYTVDVKSNGTPVLDRPPTVRQPHIIAAAKLDFSFDYPVNPTLPASSTLPINRSPSSLRVNVSKSPSPEAPLPPPSGPVASKIAGHDFKYSGNFTFRPPKLDDARPNKKSLHKEHSPVSEVTMNPQDPAIVDNIGASSAWNSFGALERGFEILELLTKLIARATVFRVTWSSWEQSIVPY